MAESFRAGVAFGCIRGSIAYRVEDRDCGKGRETDIVRLYSVALLSHIFANRDLASLPRERWICAGYFPASRPGGGWSREPDPLVGSGSEALIARCDAARLSGIAFLSLAQCDEIPVAVEYPVDFSGLGLAVHELLAPLRYFKNGGKPLPEH